MVVEMDGMTFAEYAAKRLQPYAQHLLNKGSCYFGGLSDDCRCHRAKCHDEGDYQYHLLVLRLQWPRVQLNPSGALLSQLRSSHSGRCAGPTLDTKP